MEGSAYTVGWICALSIEMEVAAGMLDEFYDGPPPPQDARDNNTYMLGRIGSHNVVIACLPAGMMGVTSAALTAAQMRWTFPSLRIGLMVGIGGGVPSEEHDIRLGDVVVSQPTGQFGGVVQYDFGKALSRGGFERIGSLNKPPKAILSAIQKLKVYHKLKERKFLTHLSEMGAKHPGLLENTTSPGAKKDQLFETDYEHDAKEATCAKCNTSRLVVRPREGGLSPLRPSDDRPVVHYGLIASGNQVIKDAVLREKLGKELKVLCFEMEAAGLMDEFPCVVIRGICDYADSHKHKKWQPYAAATAAAYAKELLLIIPPSEVAEAAEIRTIITDMRTQVNEIATAIRSDRSMQLLDRLSPVNFWDKQQDVHIRAQKGTGTWILDNPNFKSWLAGEDAVLWCRGIPGAGKTVLTSIIIDHLMKSLEDRNIGVAWIYLNYREKDLQTIENLFASLLRQLIQQGGNITEAMITSIGVSWREGKPNLTAYKTMLQKALQQYSTTFIVIDALDEARSPDLRKDLVSELRSLRPTVSLLITSRPLRDIQEILGKARQIEILAHNEDVKRYLDSYMQEHENLRKLVDADPKVQSVISDFLTRSDDGMFLKAKLQLHLLAQSATSQEVTKSLMTLPDSYTEIYAFYLKQVDREPEGDRARAFQLLSWLSHVVDPLNIDGIRRALSMQVGEMVSHEEFQADFESSISICSNLVEVDQETKTVRLLHETVEEYLKSIRSAKFPDGHSVISSTCLRYLSHDKFSKLCRLQTIVEERSREDPFYQYAAKNWPKHVILGNLEPQSEESIVDFLESQQRYGTDETMARHRHSAWGTDRSSPWTDWNRLSIQRRDPPLHAAATYGLQKTVGFLLRERGYTVDLLNNFGETALHRAAQVGQTTTMNELILNGADLNAKVQHHYLGQSTPMILASACLQLDSVRVLLNRGVDINASDPQRRLTPLHFAASMDTDLTRFLLDYGADANLPAFQSPIFPELAPMSSLHFAVYFAHAYGGAGDRVRLLLNSGAQYNLRNGSGNTALHIAILGGHRDLALALLDSGADIFLTNRKDKSPIQLAKEFGHFSWLKKWIDPPLLDDILQQTPALTQAIWTNDIPRVHQLLEQDADLTEQDQNEMSPWDYCVLSTNVEIAEILADHMDRKGLPAHVGSDAFGSALDRMTTFDYSDNNVWEKALTICIRLLKYRKAENASLDFANVRSTVNVYNKTCVILAAEVGRVAEVEFFLKCGTDVNAQDIYGSTAAHYSVNETKNRQTLPLLINYGADLGVKDRFGHTVLHTADRSSDPGIRVFLEDALAKRDIRLGQATSQAGRWTAIGQS